MTSDDTAAPGGSNTADKTSSLPFDTSVAHQARMYDYLLGGKDNYAADRAASEEMLKIYPDTASFARANRAFLERAVRYLAGEAGIRQFLDIGTGIPTAGNTHEVAQAIGPQSRVVYVDYDPIVLTHARTLLTSHEAGATEYIDKVQQQFQWRTREEMARFFEGMDLVEPGFVRVDDWRPEPGAGGTRKSAMWAAVGHKR